MREIPTFEAKCGDCGEIFSRPELGDFSYGEAILSTADGRTFATVSGFGDFQERVATLVKGKSIWPALAALADPIDDQPLVSSSVCPSCLGSNLAYWAGKKVGLMQVEEAGFTQSEALPTDVLATKLAALAPVLEA